MYLFSGDISIPLYHGLFHVQGIMQVNINIPELIVIKKSGQSTSFEAIKSLRSHT